MLEALDQSPELQDYLRQVVRANLNEMAPSIFEKIKAELAPRDEDNPFNDAAPAADIQNEDRSQNKLCDSWQLINQSNEEADKDDLILEKKIREQISFKINDHLSLSRISEGMKGGWDMVHVNASQE